MLFTLCLWQLLECPRAQKTVEGFPFEVVRLDVAVWQALLNIAGSNAIRLSDLFTGLGFSVAKATALA